MDVLVHNIPGENGTMIRSYVRKGQRNKTPILAVHGGNSHSEDPVMRLGVKTLNNLGHTVISADLPDNGNKSGGDKYKLTWTRHFNHAARFFDAYSHNQRVGLYGHSLGAAACLYYAYKNPDKVDFVVAHSPPVSGLALIKSFWRETDGKLDNIIKPKIGHIALPWHFLLSGLLYNFNTLARHISAPTLIINGTNDPFTPHKAAEQLNQRLPNGQLALIKGAGHFQQGYEAANTRLLKRKMPALQG